MLADGYVIEVWDPTFKEQGQITPRYQNGVFTPTFNNVGSWTLNLPAQHPMASKLSTPGWGITVWDAAGVQVLCGPMTRPSVVRDKNNPTGLVTIEGVTAEVVLADALAYPVPGQPDVALQVDAYDKRTGRTEQLMRGYVRDNIGANAPEERRVGIARALVVPSGGNLGRANATYSARFDTLGKVLSDLATLDGLGFKVMKVGETFELQVFQVVDRTAEIRLDVANGRLVSEQVQTVPPGRTRVIVAGQGQGEERQFLERHTPESAAAEADWGRRIEVYKDQRQTNDIVELQQAGDKDLAADGFTATNVRAIPSDSGTMVLGKDWFLGDRVTVVVSGVERPTVATKAVIRLGPEGIQRAVGIGDISGFSSDAAFRRDLTWTQDRVSAIEKNLEIPGRGRRITAGDFNLLVQSGTYLVEEPSDGNYIRNMPVPPIPGVGTPHVGQVRSPIMGELKITQVGTRVMQEYTSIAGVSYGRTAVWRRYRSGGGDWQPWIRDTIIFQANGGAQQRAVGLVFDATDYSPVVARRIDMYPSQTYVTRNGNSWEIEGGSGGFVTSPSWDSLSLQGSWAQYGSTYRNSHVMRTKAGIVVLRGLIMGGTAGSTITVLPEGCRPAYKMMFITGTAWNGDVGARIDVNTNGVVTLAAIGTTGATGAVPYLSLANIQFPCAEVAPKSAWTVMALGNGFTHFDPSGSAGWAPLSWWEDEYGRLWLNGLGTRSSTPTSTLDYGWVPEKYVTPYPIHLAGFSGAGFSTQDMSGGALRWKTGGVNDVSYFSQSSAPIIPAAVAGNNMWRGIPLQNGWVNYGAGSYPPAGAWYAPDGLVHMRGLISSGTLPTIGPLDPGYRNNPDRDDVYTTNANNAFSRVDVGSGRVTGIAGSTVWRSLDGICYLREG